MTLLHFALNSRSWGRAGYNSNTLQSIFKENQFSGAQGTAAHCFSTILWHCQELSAGSGGMQLSKRWKKRCRPTALLMGILLLCSSGVKESEEEREKKNKVGKGGNVPWNTAEQKKLKQIVEKKIAHLSSRFCPTHTRPPCRGVGLLQERWRTWKPIPQVVLQGDQEVHGVQPPFLVE